MDKQPKKKKRTRSAIPLWKRMLEIYTPDELASTSQYKLAQEFQVTQPYICNSLKQIEIQSQFQAKTTERNDEKCQDVVDFIVENGGDVVNALRQLGMPKAFRLNVYAFVKKNEIDLRRYKFAWRKYGHWLTLPGDVQRWSTADYKLPARCELCGTEKIVTLINLRTGASTRCRDCSNQVRHRSGYRKVKCVQTGKVYSSIRDWCFSTSLQDKYQQLRIVIMRDGEVKANGFNYKLVS